MKEIASFYGHICNGGITITALEVEPSDIKDYNPDKPGHQAGPRLEITVSMYGIELNKIVMDLTIDQIKALRTFGKLVAKYPYSYNRNGNDIYAINHVSVYKGSQKDDNTYASIKL